jgi:hypothetical protein
MRKALDDDDIYSLLITLLITFDQLSTHLRQAALFITQYIPTGLHPMQRR